MSMYSKEKLKQLNSLKRKCEAEINVLKIDSDNIKNEIKQKKKYLDGINKQIKEINSKSDLIISEHAIIRYLERVLDFDINKLESELIPDKVKKQIAILGNGTYSIGNSHKIVVKDNTIITVI